MCIYHTCWWFFWHWWGAPSRSSWEGGWMELGPDRTGPVEHKTIRVCWSMYTSTYEWHGIKWQTPKEREVLPPMQWEQHLDCHCPEILPDQVDILGPTEHTKSSHSQERHSYRSSDTSIGAHYMVIRNLPLFTENYIGTSTEMLHNAKCAVYIHTCLRAISTCQINEDDIYTPIATCPLPPTYTDMHRNISTSITL